MARFLSSLSTRSRSVSSVLCLVATLASRPSHADSSRPSKTTASPAIPQTEVSTTETPVVSATESPADSMAALLNACHQSIDCRGHLDRAERFFAESRHLAAIEEYLAAYRLSPYPLLLYNVARLHHKLGQLAEAEAFYQRYLDSGHPERAERARQFLINAREQLPKPEQQKESSPSPPAQADVPIATVTAPPTASVLRVVPVPMYKKWWFWSVMGFTVTGAATTVGLLLAARSPDVTGLPAMTFAFGN